MKDSHAQGICSINTTFYWMQYLWQFYEREFYRKDLCSGLKIGQGDGLAYF